MRNSLAGLMALGVLATPLSGQTRYDELGAFYALIYTPIGALPTIARARSPHDSNSHAIVEARYGRYKFRNGSRTFSNFGFTGQYRLFRALRFGGTWARRTCDGCSGLSMASVDAGTTLLHRQGLYGSGDSELGLEVSAGFGKPAKDDFSTQSFSAMLPLTVTLPQSNNGMLFLSFLPGIGYGSLKDDAGVIFSAVDTSGAVIPGPTGTFATTRMLIGASIAYLFPMGLGLHASVHRIVIQESTTQFGAACSWHF